MDRPARKNGLQTPFHPVQISSWVIQALNIICFYCIVIPSLDACFRVPFATIFSGIQIAVLILGYLLSKSVPTDNIVLLFQNTTDKVLAIQIEEKYDKYCNMCKSPVQASSKHCVRCNRCTLNFDHHCKWVNNCVGGTNYATFILLISVVVLLEFFLFIICGVVIVECIKNAEKVKNNISEVYNEDYFLFFLIMQVVVMVEGFVFTVLVSYLIGLHVYLKKIGMTTYEYILSKRIEKKVTPKNKESDKTLNGAKGKSESPKDETFQSRI